MENLGNLLALFILPLHARDTHRKLLRHTINYRPYKPPTVNFYVLNPPRNHILNIYNCVKRIKMPPVASQSFYILLPFSVNHSLRVLLAMNRLIVWQIWHPSLLLRSH